MDLHFSVRRSLVGSIIVLCTGIAIGQERLQAPPHSPPKICEAPQSLWCIARGVGNIQISPSKDPGVRNIWKLWDDEWKEYPAMILESWGCRSGYADEVKVIDYSDSYKWHGEIRNSILVSLKSDGACTLRLLSPPISEDHSENAFSMKLTSIFLCSPESCVDRPLAQQVWPAIQSKVLEEREQKGQKGQKNAN